MAYAIKKPWILSTLLSQLNSGQGNHTNSSHYNKESRDNATVKSGSEWNGSLYTAFIENHHIKHHWRIPRTEFVQLLKVTNSQIFPNHKNSSNGNDNDDKESKPMIATISDRKHSIKAQFTSECLDVFRKVCPNRRSLSELEGAVLCLSEGSFKFDGLLGEFVIQVDHFHFIGADGTAVFDIPEPIQKSRELQEFISNWLSSYIASSTNVLSQLEMDHDQYQHYTQALDIQEDVEVTSEMASRSSIDEVLDKTPTELPASPSKITDLYVSWHLEDITLIDCIIPNDQQLILDAHDSWASMMTDTKLMEDMNETRMTYPIDEVSKTQALLYRQIFGEQSPLQLVDEELHSLEEKPNPSTLPTEVITPRPSESIDTRIESMHMAHQTAISPQATLSETINSTISIDKSPTTAPIIETTTPLLFSDGSKKEPYPLSNSRSIVSAISPWSHLLNGISTTTSFHLTTTPNKDTTPHRDELDPIQLMSTSNPLSPEFSSVSAELFSSSISSSLSSRKRLLCPPISESDLLPPLSSSKHPAFPFSQTQKSFDWLPEYYSQRYQNHLRSLNPGHPYLNVRSW